MTATVTHERLSEIFYKLSIIINLICKKLTIVDASEISNEKTHDGIKKIV